jgi:hypothetical protein
MNFLSLIASETLSVAFGGYFFEKLSYVVLSAADNTLLPSVCSFALFTDNKYLSGAFLPISGYPLDNYSIQGDNKLVVRIDSNLFLPGVYDIILLNDAGYSKMSDKNYLIQYGV